MKVKYSGINIIVTAVFVVSMFYTVLQLFNLQDDLILSVSNLSSSDIPELSAVLTSFYIAIAIFIAAGLLSILLNFKNHHTGIVVSQQSALSKDNSRTNTASDANKDDTKETSDVSKANISDLRKVAESTSDKKEKYQAVLTAMCNKLEAGQGAIYLTKESKDEQKVELYTAYAFHTSTGKSLSFDFGEGLVGQVAVEGKTINIDKIPENYINIVSGLGNASPTHLLIAPLLKNKKLIGVAEIATFKAITKDQEVWVNEGLKFLANTSHKKAETTSTKKAAVSKKEVPKTNKE